MTQSAFKNIVVGIDFSDASLNALETARQRFPDAQITLLHVTDVGVVMAGDPVMGFAPYNPALGLQAQEADSERLYDLAQTGERHLALQGEPVATVLKFAKSEGADLLVVGTHAQRPVEHFFLGSTAEKLVARSPIPVLTVRLPSRGKKDV